MHDAPHPAARAAMRPAALIASIAAATLIAGTAYTRDAAPTVRYVCPDGERFTVEHLANHVRVRTGAGIFALAERDSATGALFSDGSTTIAIGDGLASLARHGGKSQSGCTPMR